MVFLRECSGKVDFINNRQMTNNNNNYPGGKEIVGFSTLHLSKVFFQLYEDLTSFHFTLFSKFRPEFFY